MDRAGARGAEAHRPGLGFGERHKVRERIGRHVGSNDQDGRQPRQSGDRREILERVIGVRIHRDTDAERAGIVETERIAVRPRRRRLLGRNHAADARYVFDHKGIVKDFAQARGKNSRQHVGIAAGGRSGDDAGRVSRISVFRRSGRRKERQSNHGCSRNPSDYRCHLLCKVLTCRPKYRAPGRRPVRACEFASRPSADCRCRGWQSRIAD